jgi:hypothetical protein
MDSNQLRRQDSDGFGCSRAMQTPLIIQLNIEEYRMLHKCANPDCTSPFRKLSQGKLFLVNVPLEAADARRTRWRVQPRSRVEYYWLCDPCAFALTLSYEKGRGVVAVPLAGNTKKMPAAALQSVKRPNPASPRSQQSA